MSQVSTDLCGKLPATCTPDSTQVQIHINPRGSTRPSPVAYGTAGGRGLDHRRRHGELTHTQPEKKAGIPIRSPGAHQHSPFADGTPDLHE
ncbi:hypothetical protein JOF56_005169 [Kibdelosporangium banguiense]|uniref:Uncharacterized protein n=1 Tax=Kibdelosporangium banguiense TaxID=1365924 RepID=A0ABS4TK32_9PSEU|nr:hypothetical protein [Kibdelosporangium banguiense]